MMSSVLLSKLLYMENEAMKDHLFDSEKNNCICKKSIWVNGTE